MGFPQNTAMQWWGIISFIFQFNSLFNSINSLWLYFKKFLSLYNFVMNIENTSYVTSFEMAINNSVEIINTHQGRLRGRAEYRP